MARTVASLAVSFVADTKKFQRGMKAAQKRIAKFRRTANRAFKGLQKASVGALAGVVAGFGALAASQASVIDSTNKVARKLGITTEKMVALQKAAEESGVETKAFNKGVQQMVRWIDEAEEGSKRAAGTFERLGLETKQLAGLSADQQLLKIATAMQSVERQTERVAIAYDLFGGRGTQMLLTLDELAKNGTKSFDEFAKKSGLAFSDEQGKAVEAMNDSLGRVFDVAKGIARQFVIAIAPSVTVAAQAFVAFATSGNNVNDIVMGIVDAVRAMLNAIGQAIAGVKVLISAIRVGLGTALTPFTQVIRGIGGLFDDELKDFGLQFEQSTVDAMRNVRREAERFSRGSYGTALNRTFLPQQQQVQSGTLRQGGRDVSTVRTANGDPLQVSSPSLEQQTALLETINTNIAALNRNLALAQ